MPRTIDDRVLSLVVTTTDLRRAAGQSFHHLWLSLGRGRDVGFATTVRSCAHGCASPFERVERRLRRVGPQARDERLRRFVADAFDRLAADVGAGDGRLLPFARWLEGRLRDLTRMMREDVAGGRVLDADLARDLRLAFGAIARASPGDVPARLRDARDAVLARG